MERLVFHEKFPVLGTLIFPGFSPVCRDFENFHKVPLCVGPVLWCGDFEIFQSSPVCGPCTGDFAKKKTKSLVCGKFYAAIFAAILPENLFFYITLIKRRRRRKEEENKKKRKL